MNRQRILMSAACLLACSAAFCAPAGPQSYLDGTPQTKNNPQIVPLRILSVDGDLPHTAPYALPPGGHWIVVTLQSASTAQPLPTQSFALKVQPCTYYYLAARKELAFQGRWKPVVDAEETITSCNPAEEIRKAQANAPKAQPASRKAPPASH